MCFSFQTEDVTIDLDDLLKIDEPSDRLAFLQVRLEKHKWPHIGHLDKPHLINILVINQK